MKKAIYAVAVAVLVLAGAVLYTAFYEPQSGVNARDEDDLTPLMLAARDGNTKAIRELLKAGADKRARSNKGNTAFDMWQSKQKNHPNYWEISRLLRP